MKREGNHKKECEDKERLMSLVSPGNDMNIRCVHDTLLGAFIVYSPEEVSIEFYENVNGHGVNKHEKRIPVRAQTRK